jgi:hypothetical protein
MTRGDMKYTKTFIFSLLLIALMIGCSKANSANFKKIQVGMSKEDAENIVGKTDNYYSDKNESMSISYSNNKVSCIAMWSNQSEQSDSISVTGLVSDLKTSFRMGDKAVTLTGIIMGDFQISLLDKINCVPPVESSLDLYTKGLSQGHIFRITGTRIGGQTSKYIRANQIENLTLSKSK